ncbi:hypothetical protein TNCV_3650481 [Trichonephila clavipes]|uniref:Uncharacterized protein n=1 Tax=Trichonephila clavipes TaxID=2585209 RepID=A0A8X6S6R4_TRICX|nr:hypothetical protein TNCV_3650481 [Trichonephila clavipes]
MVYYGEKEALEITFQERLHDEVVRWSQLWLRQPSGHSVPVPLKIYRVKGMMHIKCVEVQSPPVGVMLKFEVVIAGSVVVLVT